MFGRAVSTTGARVRGWRVLDGRRWLGLPRGEADFAAAALVGNGDSNDAGEAGVDNDSDDDAGGVNDDDDKDADDETVGGRVVT